MVGTRGCMRRDNLSEQHEEQSHALALQQQEASRVREELGVVSAAVQQQLAASEERLRATTESNTNLSEKLVAADATIAALEQQATTTSQTIKELQDELVHAQCVPHLLCLYFEKHPEHTTSHRPHALGTARVRAMFKS